MYPHPLEQRAGSGRRRVSNHTRLPESQANLEADIERPINFEPSRLSRTSLDTVEDDLAISRVDSRRSRPRSRSKIGGRDNSVPRPRSRRGRSRSASPMKAPYLSYTPSVGRNSQFYDLTDDQRNELGGIEYRSLKTLSWILVGEASDVMFTYVLRLTGILRLLRTYSYPWDYYSCAMDPTESKIRRPCQRSCGE